MKIYELKNGQRFMAPEVEHLGVLTYIKMDGMYAQVTAEDEAINKLECNRFSAGCTFFVLHCGLNVVPIND